MVTPFLLKDCTLAIMATGKSADSLTGLQELISTVDRSSLYYHFWINRLRPSYTSEDHHNDFAHWAHSMLHDDVLAERLNMIDPNEYFRFEDVRKVLASTIEDRIKEVGESKKAERRFHFLSSTLLVLDTPAEIKEPCELADLPSTLTSHALFYHFIDARRRNKNREDDFSCWLRDFGREFVELRDQLKSINPYFVSLDGLRAQFDHVVKTFFSSK